MITARQMSEILAGVSLVVIGAAFFVGAMRLPPNPFSPLDPHVVPMATAGLLTLIGMAIVAVNAFPPRHDTKDTPRQGEGDSEKIGAGAGLGAIAFMVFLTGAYVWLVRALGYLFATSLLAPVLFAVFGVVNWRQIALASVAVSALLYVTFAIGLRIHLPSGWVLQF